MQVGQQYHEPQLGGVSEGWADIIERRHGLEDKGSWHGSKASIPVRPLQSLMQSERSPMSVNPGKNYTFIRLEVSFVDCRNMNMFAQFGLRARLEPSSRFHTLSVPPTARDIAHAADFAFLYSGLHGTTEAGTLKIRSSTLVYFYSLSGDECRIILLLATVNMCVFLYSSVFTVRGCVNV
jgi:hypothetical protein